MRHNMRGRDYYGFTLIEVIVVIAIIAILAAVAVPAFSNWYPSYRLKSAAQDLFSSYQVSKLTAVRKNCNCGIAFDQPVGGDTYDYVVFEDDDNDVAYDAGERVVKSIRLTDYGGNIQITENTLPTNGAGKKAVAYRSTGMVEKSDGNLISGTETVRFRNSKGRMLRVTVSPAGHIQIL